MLTIRNLSKSKSAFHLVECIVVVFALIGVGGTVWDICSDRGVHQPSLLNVSLPLVPDELLSLSSTLLPSTNEASLTAWKVSVPINSIHQHVSKEVSKYILGACVSGDLTVIRDAVNEGFTDAVVSSVFTLDHVGDELDLIRCHVRCHDDDENCYSYCDTGRTEATCLSIAVDHGHNDLASYLLSKGADIEWQPRQRGFPVLHHAVMNDDMRMTLDLIRLGASTTAENWLGDDVNDVLDGRYHLWDICSPNRAAAMTARKDVRKNQIAAAHDAYLDQKQRLEL